MKGRAKPEGSGTPSIQIEVIDSITNEKTVYSSIGEAARSIGCTDSAIVRVLKNQREKGVKKLLKKRYVVSPVDSSIPRDTML